MQIYLILLSVFLRNFPAFVMYWSGLDSICVGISFGVSIYIVLNFNMLKCFLFFPTLFCLKKIGPLLSSLIHTQRIIKTGLNTISPISESIKSITRFKKCLYTCFPSLNDCSTGYGCQFFYSGIWSNSTL